MIVDDPCPGLILTSGYEALVWWQFMWCGHQMVPLVKLVCMTGTSLMTDHCQGDATLDLQTKVWHYADNASITQSYLIKQLVELLLQGHFWPIVDTRAPRQMSYRIPQSKYQMAMFPKCRSAQRTRCIAAGTTQVPDRFRASTIDRGNTWPFCPNVTAPFEKVIGRARSNGSLDWGDSYQKCFGFA